MEITASADPRSSYQQEIFPNYGAEWEHAEQLSTHQRSLCGVLDVRVLQPAAASCGKRETGYERDMRQVRVLRLSVHVSICLRFNLGTLRLSVVSAAR